MIRPRRVIAVTILAGCCLALISCRSATPERPVTSGQVRVFKVAVSPDGTIRLDGVIISPDSLCETLVSASGTDAEVWYYREASHEDPPGEAILVMEAILESRLPASLSSEPDFSTVVLPDGTVRRR
jgi:hypothetical protein